MMIFPLQHFFLPAIDLFLVMTLSCLFYTFVCISIAFLICFIIIFPFSIVERNVDVKGRAIVILVSNSSIGRMFARNLDKAGFRVSAAHWPPREEGTATEEECFSSMEVVQLYMTEDEYRKTVKTFKESHLSLKGMYGLMRKPSVLIWEEEGSDTYRLPGRKMSYKWKKVFSTPALCCSSLLPSELCFDFLEEEKPPSMCASAEIQKLRYKESPFFCCTACHLVGIAWHMHLPRNTKCPVPITRHCQYTALLIQADPSKPQSFVSPALKDYSRADMMEIFSL